MEIEGNLEQLFEEPEHWQRTEKLIAEINNLSSTYPDYKLSARNSTQEALDGYPDLIEFSRDFGDEDEAKKREEEMRQVEIRSATQTGVYVRLLANSYEAYDDMKTKIFMLFEKYNAFRESPDYHFSNMYVRPNSTGKSFDREENYAGVDLFFSCKEK